MQKEPKFVSIVAYVHNDADRIARFLSEVYLPCTEMFSQCELIMVNDGSTDDSADALRRFFAGREGRDTARMLRMGVYQGVESAMNAGRDLAIGDYVFEFDDLVVDYTAETVREAFETCLSGYDVVAVSANAPMRFTSGLFYRIYNKASGTGQPIGPETFRVLSRRAVNRVQTLGIHIPYRKAVYMNCGLKATRITYSETSGRAGAKAHSHSGERLSLAMDSFIYFTDVLEKLAQRLTILFFLIVVAVLVYVAYSWFADEQLVSGWVSLMGFLSIGFAGMFGLISLMFRYLSVIVDLSFRRQHYMIEEVEKL